MDWSVEIPDWTEGKPLVVNGIEASIWEEAVIHVIAWVNRYAGHEYCKKLPAGTKIRRGDTLVHTLAGDEDPCQFERDDRATPQTMSEMLVRNRQLTDRVMDYAIREAGPNQSDRVIGSRAIGYLSTTLMIAIYHILGRVTRKSVTEALARAGVEGLPPPHRGLLSTDVKEAIQVFWKKMGGWVETSEFTPRTKDMTTQCLLETIEFLHGKSDPNPEVEHGRG